ncbi:MAG: acyl-CoA dehydrogenase family protein [Pseudonocardia sp.]
MNVDARLVTDPAAVASRAQVRADAVLTGPGPATTALGVLPDRELAARLDGAGVALALVASLGEVADLVLPWAPAPCAALVAVAPDGMAVVELAGLRIEPVEAGAFEGVGGATVSVLGSAPVASWPLDPDRAFAARAGARLWCGAVLVGIAQASIDDAIDYGRRRIVFGLPVLGHQANAFELAAAATRVEAARQALAAATEHDGARFGWSATQAYLQAREAALAATDLGGQLHGGHGYLQGRPTERYFREARMLTLLWGGADAAVDDLADRVLDGPEWTW